MNKKFYIISILSIGIISVMLFIISNFCVGAEIYNDIKIINKKPSTKYNYENFISKVDNIIKMEDKAYKKHKKGIVEFTHKKHIEEYKISCGKCHHDKNGNSREILKASDKVQRCIVCHKKAKYIKGKSAKGLSPEEKREYHANAIHDNCKGCHKIFNKNKGLKSKDKGAAPITCKGCHSKISKK